MHKSKPKYAYLPSKSSKFESTDFASVVIDDVISLPSVIYIYSFITFLNNWAILSTTSNSIDNIDSLSVGFCGSCLRPISHKVHNILIG